MTIIDVPQGVRIARPAGPFSLSTVLLNENVRVPAFLAAVSEPDGSWRIARPRRSLPTPWQLRLATIFALAMAAVAPLAWLGARRWTLPIRSLADRVNAFDGVVIETPARMPRGPAEVQTLECSFSDLQVRIVRQLDERTAMLTAVAHDVRTPLTSLRIRAEDADAAVRAGMLRDLARIEHMIESVLTFARSERQVSPVAALELDSLVQDCIEPFRRTGFMVAADLFPVTILGNAIDLSRAIENIIDNATKYGAGVQVQLSVQNGTAILTVVNDGPGVPDNLLHRLSEPFFRVENSRNKHTGGLGLGLATANSIAKVHLGSLSFRNVANGFETTLRLPIQIAEVRVT